MDNLQIRDRIVDISTTEAVFIDYPVHPKESIRRVNNYLSQLRAAITTVNSRQKA